MATTVILACDLPQTNQFIHPQVCVPPARHKQVAAAMLWSQVLFSSLPLTCIVSSLELRVRWSISQTSFGSPERVSPPCSRGDHGVDVPNRRAVLVRSFVVSMHLLVLELPHEPLLRTVLCPSPISPSSSAGIHARDLTTAPTSIVVMPERPRALQSLPAAISSMPDLLRSSPPSPRPSKSPGAAPPRPCPPPSAMAVSVST